MNGMIRFFRRYENALLPLSLVFLVLISYGNTLGNWFVSDDRGLVQNAASWTWGSAVTQSVIHAHTILWLGIYKFFGLTPWPYHALNIFAHVLSTLLVFAIVTRIHTKRIGFVSAALFAVHPILTESVTWISGGIYAMYGMWFLCSFWLYLKAKDDKKHSITNFYRLFSILCFIASLLFSEKAIVLVLVFVVYELMLGTIKKTWQKLMPYLIVSSIFILFYLSKIGMRIEGVAESSGGQIAGWYKPWELIPIALTSYLRLFIWPQALTLYHSEMVFSRVAYLARVGILAALAAAAVWLTRKDRRIGFWALWFVIPLLSTLTPLPIAWVVAERYIYLSTVGLCALTGLIFDYVLIRLIHLDWVQKRKTIRQYIKPVFFIFFLFLLALLSSRTIIRSRDWKNEDTLWIAASQYSPSSPQNHNNLGDMFGRWGDQKKAVKEFQIAIALNPRYAEAYHNLGVTYRQMGEPADAVLVFEEALAIKPTLWESHVELAGIAFDKKDFATAQKELETALSIVPGNPTILRNLSVLQQARGVHMP